MDCLKLFLIFALFITSIVDVKTSKILFIHPLASHSPRVSMEPLAHALLERGHEITYIACTPPVNPHPKVKEIMPKTLVEFVENFLNAEFTIEHRIENRMPPAFQIIDYVAANACEVLLTSAEFKEWIQTSPEIDLIVFDLLPECALGIAFKLNAKVISYITAPFFGKLVEDMGLPDESLVTNSELAYKPTMSFWERVKNTLVPLGWSLFGSFSHSKYENVISSALNISNLPSISELQRNISLVFMTGNFISEQSRSLPPMFISVPGLHVTTQRNPPPKEIESFINTPGSESDGFVYISLGTVVVAPNLPKNVLNVFFNTIKAFPKLRFLWRWGGEVPEERPSNLLMAKWFPQRDLLQHPLIKAFVSQVGRPSFQEALGNGVPMIGFPILGDQDFNAMRMEQLGVGIALEIGDVTEEQFKDALSQAVYGTVLRNNAKKASILFKDLPMRPVDTAVWWTEFVLRHDSDDLSHLKPIAMHQSWWQRRLLDVWAFLALTVGAFLVSFAFLFVTFAKYFLAKYERYFGRRKEKLS